MKIESISFYRNERRHSVRCRNGKFGIISKTSKPRKRSVSAYEFVTDPVIIDCDPVLTLVDGQKIRVYQGGDPSYMLVESSSLIEIHDNEYKNKSNKKIIPKNGKKRYAFAPTFDFSLGYDDDYGW